MKNIEIYLSNQDCIFDNASFEDATEAANWATGRGEKYIIQTNSGLNVKVKEEKFFVESFPGEYEEISRETLIAMLNASR